MTAAVAGGTVVVLMDQEPATLNPILRDGKAAATACVTSTVLESLYTVTADGRYRPQLLARHAELSEDDRTVTYTLRQDATWSDGRPVTADDVVFSYETMMCPGNDVPERDGYDLVEAVEPVDARTVRLRLTRPYAGYRDLFNSTTGAILPRHALAGADFNTVWTDGPGIASGPFRFERWRRGEQLSVVRNERYREPPGIGRIVFAFVADTAAQVAALRRGEADVIFPAPTPALLAELRGESDVGLAVGPGLTWEHLTFQHRHPLLGRRFVRQAIAYAIDRQALARESVVAPHGAVAEPLHSLVHRHHHPDYAPNFARYRRDPATARRLLEDNGCRRLADGSYTYRGAPLRFRLETTAGNERRRRQQEWIAAWLRDVGIVVDCARPPAARLLPRIFRGDFDLACFAWVGNPDPVGQNALWMSADEGHADGGGVHGQNYGNYRSAAVTARLDRTFGEVDPRARAALYDEADRLMAEDLPCLPLYVIPSFVAWRRRLRGPAPNPNQNGPLWNVRRWRLARNTGARTTGARTAGAVTAGAVTAGAQAPGALRRAGGPDMRRGGTP